MAANYYLGMQVSSLERIRTLAQVGQEFPVDLYTRSDTSDLAHVPGIRCRGGATTHTEYFTVGEDLECYENTAELLDKIAYYLDHEDERLQIAEQGLRKVKERHTYIHRACQMMQVLFPEAF